MAASPKFVVLSFTRSGSAGRQGFGAARKPAASDSQLLSEFRCTLKRAARAATPMSLSCSDNPLSAGSRRISPVRPWRSFFPPPLHNSWQLLDRRDIGGVLAGSNLASREFSQGSPRKKQCKSKWSPLNGLRRLSEVRFFAEMGAAELKMRPDPPGGSARYL
jgi:hypothetical protein